MNIDEIKNIIMESDTDDLSEITECISKRLRDIFEDNGKRREMYEVAKKYYSLLNKGNENMDLNEKLKLKEELDILSAPYSDNIAYHAFLEMERLAKLKV